MFFLDYFVNPYISPYVMVELSLAPIGLDMALVFVVAGLQESIVVCVEGSTEDPVAPYFCESQDRLDIEVRACNEKPCPPR